MKSGGLTSLFLLCFLFLSVVLAVDAVQVQPQENVKGLFLSFFSSSPFPFSSLLFFLLLFFLFLPLSLFLPRSLRVLFLPEICWCSFFFSYFNRCLSFFSCFFFLRSFFQSPPPSPTLLFF